MTQTTTLAQMQSALNALRQAPQAVSEFSQLCRTQTALLEALPPQFGEVLHNLLDRLESSALFAEESCSFSQKELLDSLQLWLDKARARLSR